MKQTFDCFKAAILSDEVQKEVLMTKQAKEGENAKKVSFIVYKQAHYLICQCPCFSKVSLNLLFDAHCFRCNFGVEMGVVDRIATDFQSVLCYADHQCSARAETSKSPLETVFLHSLAFFWSYLHKKHHNHCCQSCVPCCIDPA